MADNRTEADTRTLVDALVRFWHTKDHGQFLDDAARAWIAQYVDPLLNDDSAGFTVGQRVYWVHEDTIPLIWPLPPNFIVHSGVVMSTGPAVTQIWNDNASDPREHYAQTFANDKIWAGRATPERIAHDKSTEAYAPVQAALDEPRNQ